MWKSTPIYRKELEFLERIEGLVLIDSREGFELYEARLGKGMVTTLIRLPRASTHPEGGPFRGDIVWLWKAIAERPASSIWCGREGGFSLYLTNDPLRYQPEIRPKVGNFTEATLLWEFILYILSLSAHRQQAGKERRIFENTHTPVAALAALRRITCAEGASTNEPGN